MVIYLLFSSYNTKVLIKIALFYAMIYHSFQIYYILHQYSTRRMNGNNQNKYLNFELEYCILVIIRVL